MLDSGFTKTINAGIYDERATFYDATIIAELRTQRDRLCKDPQDLPIEGTPWFPTPLCIRAMIFVESGGPAGPSKGKMFDEFPMQVGYRKADKALGAMQAGVASAKATQGAGIVPTPAVMGILRASLEKNGRAWLQGTANVRLGINYIFMLQVRQMKQVSKQKVGPPELYVVGSGDSLEKIAKRQGSTVEAILLANLGVTKTTLLKKGDKLEVPPAEHSPAMVFGDPPKENEVPDWLHKRYNVGDASYPAKLRYVMNAFRERANYVVKVPDLLAMRSLNFSCRCDNCGEWL